MPEGPSIFILRELTEPFIGKKVIEIGGNTKEETSKALNKKVTDIKTWGKHFLICFQDLTIRVHLMLFGSYRINEEKDAPPRLTLKFKNGFINFYSCSIKLIEEDLDKVYDWSADIMSPTWSAANAKKKLKARPDMLVCDALLDQNIFAGSGNIIKNEVLFRIKVHPLSLIGKLPSKQLKLLIDETHNYAFDFLKWKKIYELKKHYQVYNRKICPCDNTPIVRKHVGKFNRRTFFCPHCQILYK